METQKTDYICTVLINIVANISHLFLAYGDHGIVFTAIAAQVDEDYQNIVSIPSTPMEIDNKMDTYPGFNFGVSMISFGWS